MANRKDLTSAVIISYPLLNSFVGPVPTNPVDLSLRAQRRTYGTTTILISNRGRMWNITRGVTRIWGLTKFGPRNLSDQGRED